MRAFLLAEALIALVRRRSARRRGRRGSRRSRRRARRPGNRAQADRTAEQLKWWRAQSGQQGGDPAKLARALVAIASEQPPPRRFIAGADAIALAEQKVADLRAQIDAYRDLSTSLAFDELEPAGSAR